MKCLITYTETYEQVIETENLEEAQRKTEDMDSTNMDYLSCSSDIFILEEKPIAEGL